MSLKEAEMLPVVESNPPARRPRPRRQDHGIPMTDAIPKVLMLRSAAVSHQDVRSAARQAGISLNIASAASRGDFLDQLRRDTFSLILAGPDSVEDLDFRELLERARAAQPPVPVILIGGRPSQTESLRTLREGATDYLSIGRLAALISHEINNPLEAVTNLLYLVSEEKGLPDRAKEYLSLAQRELERVGQISRQTLNFSRETTTPVSTRVDELMEEVLTLYGRRIADRSLQVDRQYSCPEEALVFPGEMRQVLSNLITNAIEASSPRGRLRVRIRCARNWSDPGVRGIRISVGDTGTGIPAEVQRRLGEPFFTTKGQRGTGLGLWVTRSIIQRYGGDIHLRSSTARHRHGTVFSIFLPTNMRPTVVGKDFDSDGGGSGSGSPKLRPLTTSGISRNRAATNETRRKFVTELPPHRRASGD
jgi:signal transduction histidine kinase